MAKNNNTIYWIIGIIILAVLVLPKLDTGLFSVGLPNPSAVFCEEQGYTFDVEEVNGQKGICKSTFTKCDAWIYYAKCKPEGWESYIPPTSYTQEELDACELYCETEETVCCKIFAPGAPEYNLIKVSDCIIRSGMEVDDSYCDEEPICPAVCVPMWEIKPGGNKCTYNECGSGCGPDGITTFETLIECETYLGEECIFTINEFCIKLWMLLLGLGAILLIYISTKK